jgi:hypothetical protein
VPSSTPRPVPVLRRLAALGAAILAVVPGTGAAAAPGISVTAGVLERSVEDTFTASGDEAGHREVAQVVTAAGTTVQIPHDLAENLRSGTRVSVTRSAAGKVTRVTTAGGVSAAAAPGNVAGQHYLTIVPVYWQAGGPPSGPAPAAFTDAVKRADAFYDQATGGKIRHSLDRVLPWAKIADPGNTCDTNAIEAAARPLAGNTVKDQFHHLVIYFPNQSACGFSGRGNLGTGRLGDSVVWLNGTLDTQTVGHELGHNLGLPHSNSYDCWADAAHTTPVPLSGDCAVTEYADPWEVMGSRSAGNFTAAHLDQLGVLPAGATRQAVDNVPATLAPVASGSGLRQLTWTAGTRTYFLEYRDGTGLDRSQAQPWGGTGLAVRFTDTALTGTAGHHLIRFRPEVPTAVLQPGQGWYDPAGGFSIRTGAATSAGLPVTVGRTADRQPPSAFVITGPSSNKKILTGTVKISWTPVTDNDNPVTVTVNVDGKPAITVPAGAGSALVPVPDGTRTLTAVAADAYGNTRAGTGSVTVTVDGVGPVADPAPSAYSAPGQPVTLTSVPMQVNWGLRDATGVSSQKIAQRTSAGGPVSYTSIGTSVRKHSTVIRPGTPTFWQIQASDPNGHTAVTAGIPVQAAVDAQNSRSSGYSGTWSTVKAGGALGGAEHRSTAAGASVTYTFTGRSIAWVGSRDKTSGNADVFADGRKITTTNQYSGVTQPARVLCSLSWPNVGTHTITIVNRPSGTRNRTAVDGFVVLS